MTADGGSRREVPVGVSSHRGGGWFDGQNRAGNREAVRAASAEGKARHAEVLKHDVDDDQFAVAYDQLMNVTGELVEFEATIPERLAAPDRQRSERIVMWSWRAQAVVAAVLIALVFILDRSWWWLILLLPHFAEPWPAASKRSTRKTTATAGPEPSPCTWPRSWWHSSA
ncbi:hypothetical protein K7472_30350 [Streptomyces sp. PTM05]|uniref:Uncharacterized protein n=1 Tax=Streptantibioticus parmotrematis TaxID=2873249 RepID=A0ABS7R0X4_9ACTN|nr:hypothetical protein [Streptantibioticus parmotrematis]MBY8889115.1 hypothetical protein [Streptantibioticus parmotrematis]